MRITYLWTSSLHIERKEKNLPVDVHENIRGVCLACGLRICNMFMHIAEQPSIFLEFINLHFISVEFELFY